MSYALRFEQKPAFLHAVITGENTRENVARYLADVLRECKVRNCTRVLVEERLEGPRLQTMDVFSIASAGGAPALGTLQAIAYVDVNAQGHLMQFAENVAVNRGLPVRVFNSLPEAEDWLKAQPAGGSAH
jgi:hypothetical protein